MLRTLSVDRTSTRARECNTTTKKNLHAIVALLPIEVGRRADTGLAADVGHRHPSLPCFRMNASCASENLDAALSTGSSNNLRSFAAASCDTTEKGALPAVARRRMRYSDQSAS